MRVAGFRLLEIQHCFLRRGGTLAVECVSISFGSTRLAGVRGNRAPQAACGIKDDTLNARSFCLSRCCKVMPNLAVFIPSRFEFHFEESFIGFL